MSKSSHKSSSYIASVHLTGCIKLLCMSYCHLHCICLHCTVYVIYPSVFSCNSLPIVRGLLYITPSWPGSHRKDQNSVNIPQQASPLSSIAFSHRNSPTLQLSVMFLLCSFYLSEMFPILKLALLAHPPDYILSTATGLPPMTDD